MRDQFQNISPTCVTSFGSGLPAARKLEILELTSINTLPAVQRLKEFVI